MSFKSFLKKYQQEIFLFFAALFIRFPFFFRDYIDRDESTFILMGQSIADGYLPYDHLWDLKPPLLFYFFGLIQYLFPGSFVAIRFFGVIIVFLSAWLLMKIARQSNLRNGFLIGLGYVLLSSEFGSLQGVMSEHLAVCFLLFGVFFLLKEKSWHLLLAGVSFGCAILCKLNYAYAVVAVILVYFFINRRSFLTSVRSMVLYGIGILIPLSLIILPFWIQTETQLFIDSVFLAPLEYSNASQLSWIEKLKTTWWVIALVILVSFLAIRKSEQNTRLVFISIGILIGTTYTFYSSGIINGHYLVQLYPFLLLLMLGVLIKKTWKPKLAIVALGVVLVSAESLLEYYKVLKGVSRESTPYIRPSFKAVNEIRKRQLENEKILFADYHIGYWLLDRYPLTKSTTHPSNLSRPYLFKYFDNPRNTSLAELKYVMEEVSPGIIVSKFEDLDFFPDDSPENSYFKEKLDKEFKMIYKNTIDRLYIWERVKK